MSARKLSANSIKWIAIAAMLIDHIAWGFVPTYSVLGQMMHIVGRITAPTMCFFLAEGYAHTHNFQKYALRLGIFALISHVPFVFFEAGEPLRLFPFSVIYTLLLSLLAICAYDKIENQLLRVMTILGLCVLSLPGDWMCFDILFALAFWQNRGNFRRQARAFSIVAAAMVVGGALTMFFEGYSIGSQLFQAGVFLCLPILSLYNGQRGGGRYSRWTFYLFYPAHLLVLGLLVYYLK
ncbi:MAG: conjugal transfer protein TraX [Oscillospiraceae bacterium]|jgi:hypothetical protein|nr:conjugal transfer protein TraX [Oscillospiraceae bacterium]